MYPSSGQGILVLGFSALKYVVSGQKGAATG